MRGRRHLRTLDDDIRAHIEQEVQDNIGRGMPPEEARTAALRKFGNVLRVYEETYEVWNPIWFEQLCQDARYACRLLRRNMLFTAVVVLMLALGIGANTAVFSVVNAVVLRPLPYPAAERLFAYSDGLSSARAENFKPGIAGADFVEWRAEAKSFDGMAGYFYSNASLATAHDAGPARVATIAGDFWALTGARPALGHLFAPGAPQDSVVLTYKLFERRFGADPHVIGTTANLDARPVTIAGVLRPDFEFLFPQGRTDISPADIDVFTPAPPLLRSTRQRVFVAAKLKPQASVTTAVAELRAIETRIQRAYPDRWFAGVSRMDLVPLQQKIIGNARQALFVLQMAGLFVLLIACMNMANLLMARSAARGREIAIRSAIGAGAGRMLRQFLAEGLVLAAIGGVAGLVLARVTLAILMHFGQHAVPRLTAAAIDLRVLAFTAGISLLSGLLFSFGPAISLAATNIQNPLKDGAANASPGSRSLHIRQLLVGVELALAIVLLTGAGLMLKSFWRMYTNPPGFAPEDTLVMRVALSGPQYATKSAQVSYIGELLRRIQSLPGVQAAGIADTDIYLLQTANAAVPPIVEQFQESLVSSGYFAAIGMRLKEGRWILDTDPAEATVINETMARRAFGDLDPIGRRIDRLGRPVRVIGVMANLKYSKLDAEPGPEIYRPYVANLHPGRRNITVAVRLPGDPLHVASGARKMIAAIDPTQPVYDIESLQHALSQSIAPRRFNFFILGAFAAAALVLAIVGIYGVIAYSVSQRTREIGIRIAVGAQRGEIVRMVVVQGLTVAASGVAAGVAAALCLTQFIQTLLYDVKANDPFTFVFVALGLTAISVFACAGPALRAAVVDPLKALRYE